MLRCRTVLNTWIGIAVACFLATALSGVARASEIDDFTSYRVVYTDSRAILNREVNQHIAKALAGVRGCDIEKAKSRIADELVSYNFFFGALEKFATNSPEIDRTQTVLKDSIYRDSVYSRSIIGRTFGIYPSLNLTGIVLGTDKLGHFFDHGYSLFKHWRKSKLSNKELLLISTEEEEGNYGWVTTGIKSYADIVANFEGYLFWREVFAETNNTFLACREGSIRQVRSFDFADYVNPGWSEAINCSEFADDGESGDATFKNEVSRNVEELERATGQRYACPIEPKLCRDLIALYTKKGLDPAKDLPLLLHPSCRMSK